MSPAEIDILIWIVKLVAWLVIGVGVAQNAIYLLQLFLAWRHLKKRAMTESGSSLWRQFSDITPPISILVPAYNEESMIIESVRSLISLHYPLFEVIVINDGSQDETLRSLITAFELVPLTRTWEMTLGHKPVKGLYGNPKTPNLLIVDKENGGKADALNAGLNLSRMPLFCAVDADSLIEENSLLRCVEPFIEDSLRTIAVGGTIRVANGCTVDNGRVTRIGLPSTLVPLLQTIEYLRAFLIGRLGLGALRAVTLVSGAFGIIRREIAVAAGGYSTDTVGEDMEIIVKMQKTMMEQNKDFRVYFIPEPVCWTEVPSSLSVLRRQRARWQRGALETFFKYRNMLFNRRCGRLGTIGFGHMLLIDVIGPPVECTGYILFPLLWYLGLIEFDFVLAFLAVTFSFGVFISVGSLILEENELHRFSRPRDLLVLLFAAIVENFGYRQLNNVYRMEGWWGFLKGTKGHWGVMTRRGFLKQQP